MTQTLSISSFPLTATVPTLSYTVAMSRPTSHLFEVTLEVKNWQAAVLDLKMPVWTPGSYLVREYARNVQKFYAKSSRDGQILSSKKVRKNYWQVETEGISEIRIDYRVFANELSVRTNHLDGTHGYFNGAALFCFIPGLEKAPITVTIIVPQSDWKVSTALPQVEGKVNTYLAKDFDTLVDSPFEIGTQRVYDFEVWGKPHQLVIWGQGNADPDKIIEDTTKIIETEASLYGGMPYDRYLFILHLSNNGFGGLEHKNSCCLNYSRFGFRAKDKYQRFLQLVAHEYFHLWNIKRLRPKALEVFDYEAENYTTCLWFSEGTTSYYDLLIPLRSQIYDRQTFLKNLGKEITRFLAIPGRKIQSLSEASFDAWIKLYRRDSNSDNCQISYYLKGELVSLLLDLLIRQRHQNQRSLDDVMRQMWEQFGKQEIGFTSQQLQQVIEAIATTDLSDFFRRYLDGTDELPFDEYLEPFGLQLKSVMEEEPFPYLGIQIQTENSKQIIKSVTAESPAWLGGIDPGDELLAIDGMRVTADTLNERLKDYQANDTIEIAVFHQEQLRTIAVELAAPQPNRYEVVQIDNPTTIQQQNLADWLPEE